LADIYKELDMGAHDHIWIDLSSNGPPLRKNITKIITVAD